MVVVVVADNIVAEILVPMLLVVVPVVDGYEDAIADVAGEVV